MTAGGTLLFVDAGRGTSAVEVLDPAARRRLGGGGLLGVDLLLRHTPAGLDPFDPRAMLVLATGPASGQAAVGLPRVTFVAKSPLSGGIGEARMSGPFGVALRRTGHDAIAVVGAARGPSYLLVQDGRPRVVAARELVGLDTAEKTDVLRDRHGDGASVAVAGPAGERRVRYASIVCDYGHVAPRMGLGAVMAAKGLLGVVVCGGQAPLPADPATVDALGAEVARRIPGHPLATEQHDPPGFGAWPGPGREGYLAVENLRTARPGDWSAFTADRFAARHDGTAPCPGCPQDCLKRFPAAGLDARASVLHQEAVAAFAANLGIRDLDAVLALNARCTLWGVDPVSLSWTLSAVMEAAADGALDGPLARLAPRFGDAGAIAALCEDVVFRRGGADLLAEGSARVARSHPAVAPYALHVKGVEIGAWDPRGSHGQALAYAFSPVGPRYDGVEHDIDFDPDWGRPSFIARAERHGCPPGGLPMDTLDDRKVAQTVSLWELWSGYDVLGVCNFTAPPTRTLDEDDVLALVTAVTGWDVDHAEVAAWGRRRLTTMRTYNAREGFGPGDDALPDRVYDRPVDAGRLRGARLDRDAVARGLAALRARYDTAPDFDRPGAVARLDPRSAHARSNVHR